MQKDNEIKIVENGDSFKKEDPEEVSSKGPSVLEVNVSDKITATALGPGQV